MKEQINDDCRIFYEDEIFSMMIPYFFSKEFKISMEDNKRNCHYQRQKSAYEPQKVEVLNDSPLILLYHNFVTDKEAEKLIEHVMPKVK